MSIDGVEREYAYLCLADELPDELDEEYNALGKDLGKRKNIGRDECKNVCDELDDCNSILWKKNETICYLKSLPMPPSFGKNRNYRYRDQYEFCYK